MTSNSRLYGADFIRASACLIVLFHHLAQRVNFRSELGANPFLQVFNSVGGFGVAMFFVLSGFLLARPFWQALDAGAPMPSLRVYALRRAARIIPGFWLALTVTFVLTVAVFGATPDGWLWLRYAAGLLLVSDWHWTTLFPVEINGPLWSIGFEVTSYLLLPFCLTILFACRLPGWPGRLAWLGVIAAVLALHWLVVQWAPIDEVERGWDHGLVGGAKAWMPRFNPIGFFAIFALGALAAGVQVKLASLRHWLFDLLGLMSIGGAGWLMATHMGGLTEGFGLLGIPYGYPWMPIAVGVALVALPSSVLAGRLLDNTVSRFIAQISFGIYIWHFLIIGLLARLLPPSFQTSGPDGWSIWLWSSAIAIALSVVVATISFHLLEQPMVRWARRLEKRERLEPALA